MLGNPGLQVFSTTPKGGKKKKRREKCNQNEETNISVHQEQL